MRLAPCSVNVSVSSCGAGLSLAKVDFATSSRQRPVNASAADNHPTDDPSASMAHSNFLIIAPILHSCSDQAYSRLTSGERIALGATRRVYWLNTIVSALMLVLFTALSVALGTEIYRCDVLGIPNCD